VSAEIIQVEDGVALYAAVNPNTNLIYLSYPFSNFILEIDISTKTTILQTIRYLIMNYHFNTG